MVSFPQKKNSNTEFLPFATKNRDVKLIASRAPRHVTGFELAFLWVHVNTWDQFQHHFSSRQQIQCSFSHTRMLWMLWHYISVIAHRSVAICSSGKNKQTNKHVLSLWGLGHGDELAGFLKLNQTIISFIWIKLLWTTTTHHSCWCPLKDNHLAKCGQSFVSVGITHMYFADVPLTLPAKTNIWS